MLPPRDCWQAAASGALRVANTGLLTNYHTRASTPLVTFAPGALATEARIPDGTDVWVRAADGTEVWVRAADGTDVWVRAADACRLRSRLDGIYDARGFWEPNMYREGLGRDLTWGEFEDEASALAPPRLNGAHGVVVRYDRPTNKYVVNLTGQAQWDCMGIVSREWTVLLPPRDLAVFPAAATQDRARMDDRDVLTIAECKPYDRWMRDGIIPVNLPMKSGVHHRGFTVSPSDEDPSDAPRRWACAAVPAPLRRADDVSAALGTRLPPCSVSPVAVRVRKVSVCVTCPYTSLAACGAGGLRCASAAVAAATSASSTRGEPRRG